MERIVRDFVAGISPKQIAKNLNPECVAGPFGGAWTPSTTSTSDSNRESQQYGREMLDVGSGRGIVARGDVHRLGCSGPTGAVAGDVAVCLVGGVGGFDEEG